MVEGFASRLSKARAAKGLTKNALGNLAGVSGSMIGRYENSDRQPTLEVLIKLALALKVTTDQLLGIKHDHNDDSKISINVTDLTPRQISSVENIVAECRSINKID